MEMFGKFLTLAVLVSGYGRVHAGFRQVCDPETHPSGCPRTPRAEDTLNMEAFVEHVNGTKFSVLWSLDGARFPNYFSPYMLEYQTSVFETQPGGSMVLDDRVYRNGLGPNATCVQMPDSPGTVVDGQRAIYDIDMESPISGSRYRFWMISSDPSKYVLVYGCQDRSSVVDGRCFAPWKVDLCVLPTLIDRPPLREIADDLWWSVGLRPDNQWNTFLHMGMPC